MHNSFLHLLLKHRDFLNINISQGIVATRLGCGGVFKYDCYKFPSESNSERNLKNRLTFGEVTISSIVSCFLTHSVHRYDTIR